MSLGKEDNKQAIKRYSAKAGHAYIVDRLKEMDDDMNMYNDFDRAEDPTSNKKIPGRVKNSKLFPS